MIHAYIYGDLLRCLCEVLNSGPRESLTCTEECMYAGTTVSPQKNAFLKVSSRKFYIIVLIYFYSSPSILY